MVLSWFVFCLSRKDLSNRINLGLTTVLTITLFMVSVNAGLPKIGAVKAVDYYLIACFVMVFLVFIRELSHRRHGNDLRTREKGFCTVEL